MVYDPRIRAGIFAGESGGDYNALFGYQNRPNGRFSDINLTSMPISDVIAFTDPSGPYAQYVKGQVGRVATPVGAYQVVGSTLRDAVNALGIDPNTTFNQATQDRIGQWILENQGTGAWEGYQPNAAPVQISTSGVETMPMTPQQPQGLLGLLGIQKQDPTAVDQTALPFYQRDRFRDVMGNLAIGLNSLRMNPDAALPQMVMARREGRAAEQQNNRTIEWLRSQPNGERFAGLAEAVGAGPALQMYQEAMKGPDQTAAEQNFAAYQRILATQGPEAADLFITMAKGGTSINMPAQIGTIPAGYRVEYGPNNMPVAMVPIAGGPADTEAQAAAAADAARARVEDVQESVAVNIIDDLVSTLDQEGIFNLPEAGIIGQAISPVNQEARDFANKLSTIQSIVAFDRLQQMRDASKTGGALGAVSTNELDLLMSSLGTLQQSSSPAALRDSLLNIKRIMTKIDRDPVASQLYYGGGQSAGQPTGGDGFTVTGTLGTR